MASKAISTIGKYAAKKIGNKTFDKAIQKISEPYKRLKRKAFGIKPLNVGERETIKYLVDMIPENDIETIYRVLVRFVPETEPLPDEIEAILEAKTDTSPTVSHDEINWD